MLRAAHNAIALWQQCPVGFAMCSKMHILLVQPDNNVVSVNSGVAVFSKRAVPLAAWTSGFELAALVADTDRACVILETGVNQRWRYGSYRRNPETNAEARQWEDAKKLVK